MRSSGMWDQRPARAVFPRFPGGCSRHHIYGADVTVSPVGRLGVPARARPGSGPTLVLPGEPDVRTLHRDLHTVRTRLHLVELDAARQALDLLVEVGDGTEVGVGEGDVA